MPRVSRPAPERAAGRLVEEAARRLAGSGVPSPRVDAERLLRRAAGWSEAEMVAEWRSPPAPEAAAAFDRLVEARSRRVPLQHLLGFVDFRGIRIRVGPEALIPRPETEILVGTAVRWLRDRPNAAGGDPAAARRLRGPAVADVGCGGGAVALALAHSLPEARIVGLDVSPDALALSRRNIEARAGPGPPGPPAPPVHLLRSDLLAGLRPGALDAIVANLPYVPSDEIAGLEPEVRDFEPRLALDGGPDGLDPLRRFLPMAARALAPDGALFFEIGAGQAEAARRLAGEAGFDGLEFVEDFAGRPRVARAWRRAPVSTGPGSGGGAAGRRTAGPPPGTAPVSGRTPR